MSEIMAAGAELAGNQGIQIQGAPGAVLLHDALLLELLGQVREAVPEGCAYKGGAGAWGMSGAGRLTCPMVLGEQQLLFSDTPRATGDVQRHERVRHITNCLMADPAYGCGAAGAAGISAREVQEALDTALGWPA
jgi:catalase